MADKKKIDGFGLIGIMIVIAVIALAGGGGLYWKETKKQQSLLQIGADAARRAEELKQAIKSRDKSIYGGSTSINSEVDTSNWKTYRNEKYGFEIKYPSDWDFSEVQQIGVPYGFIIHPKKNDFDGRYSLFSILPGSCQLVLNTIPKKVTVNGIIMERYDYIQTTTPLFHFAGNANNGWDPECNTIQFDSEINPDLYDQFEQILFTFKFTK